VFRLADSNDDLPICGFEGAPSLATILAHIQIHSGKEAEFEALARELFEGSAREPAKRHYEYWRGAEPGLYYCLLAFDDFHGFLTHQTSDHHEKASPELGKLIDKMQLEWVDPVGGASELPPTEMQALAENPDELTTRYHGLYTAKIQNWWRSLRGDSDQTP
jgi:quinol monooxygenase YgiN